MSYYDLCCQHKGQVVRITERCGKVHVGRIAHVDQKNVWMERAGSGHGFGYGYHGYHGHPGHGHHHAHGYHHHPGYGPDYGHGGFIGRNPHFFPVALAGIGGFALGSAFFW
ncbi:hypothetical protein J2S74_003951 [Evansella vedderi]|uniref:Uncharacterized protein n=2 Tax=Evansella vedderi TaxID=38282 RepID=A0ABT9ZZ54_9BACI|nr:hypothetical protein [Evansella vedderi]MDQ0256531.1 hypothetical protein [Evansella vedderi]